MYEYCTCSISLLCLFDPYLFHHSSAINLIIFVLGTFHCTFYDQKLSAKNGADGDEGLEDENERIFNYEIADLFSFK